MKVGVVMYFGHGGMPCPNQCTPEFIDADRSSNRPRLEIVDAEPIKTAESLDDDDEGDGLSELDDEETIRYSQMQFDCEAEAMAAADSRLRGDGAEPRFGKKGKKDGMGRPIILVVDRTGMHELPVVWCRCHGHPADDLQALDMGFMAGSFKNVQTLFTLSCLDDYLADNQECRTSKWHYFQKLRRFTSSSFPHLVPVSNLA